MGWGGFCGAGRVATRRSAVRGIREASASAEVGASAADALVTHGTSEDVPKLVAVATANNQADSAAAKRTLQQMGANGVDEALIALSEKSDTDAKAMIIRTLAARNSRAAVPMLLKLVSGGETALVGEASTALGVVG